MFYTLTKYLTADYLRENDFLKAFLELVDEIIFCCNMESIDILSNMSFEDMDDDYFLAYQDFFLNGLPTYNINELDKTVLSQWFSFLHVRGELSNIDKLFKFGGSLKNKIINNFELYHNADVPNETLSETKDGLIYLFTEENIQIGQDYFINQQIPAGYRIGLIRNPPPFNVIGGDDVICIKEAGNDILVIAGDDVNLLKEFEGDIPFYRRRQFDQYYTFGQLYRSQYTINQLSQYHRSGYYFFGFDVENYDPNPEYIDVDKSIYTGIGFNSIQFLIEEGLIEKPHVMAYSGSFADGSITTFEDLDGAGGIVIKNYLSRHSSITPFNGELVVGGNIKKTIPPSEEGDYGYMNDTRDFDMSDIEIGYVGKPVVFYSSTLTEKTGTWGTIPMSRELKGYLRGAAYQTSNKAVSANSSNYLYPEGESGFLQGDASKTYTLTGAYTNTGTSVSIVGCSVVLTSGNLKLEWGSTAASVCYVTIEES